MNYTDKEQYPEHYKLVEAHIEKHFSDATITVFNEIPILDIRLDVYHIKPNGSDFEILLTNGMSSIAMNVDEIPENSDAYAFAELMTLIPQGVDFGKTFPSKKESDWIISMIKRTAKFPHFNDTWIGIGHSIQATTELSPYSDKTNFSGALILPTMTFPEEFQKIASPHGAINIYSVFPLYKEELRFKVQHGFNTFIQFLIKNNTEEVIDFNRTNFCG